jgi:hypothetical protein
MRVVHGLGSGWGRLRQRSCIACPDEDSAFLIHRQAFRVHHFLFEVFEIHVIQIETQLERAIGEAFFTCEQLDDLCQDLGKFHGSLLRLRQRGLSPGLFYNQR